MIDLSRRREWTEWMDEGGFGYEAFVSCLRDLERANVLSLGYRPTLRWLDRLRDRHRPQRLRILDVGCGHGDALRRVAAWAARRGVAAELVGVDMNPLVIRAAEAATPSGLPIRYVVADVFDYAEGQAFDVILSALFTHHLDDAALARFVGWMDRHAGLGWFINDLHRHPLPYYALKLIMPALRLDRMVCHDGPISVARAFRRADWQRALAGRTDPAPAEIRWHFPFRWGVGAIR
ncbi:MAG TPA: methyltransferase domain-containing protein [Alphaproteobacteria bacterium]|nr:methyltransferase domain-containing protein [Alphaproteobacteria bacterium]